MLDEQGKQNFFDQLHRLWIQPEVDRRFAETGIPIPSDFKIWRCLIKLPKNQAPIVEFNDEAGWEIEHPELAPGVELEVGKPVYLHDVIGLGKVLPPTVDGERVAFIYLYWNGFSYSIVFDFKPNSDDFDSENDDFRLGESIANYLWLWMIEMAVKGARVVQPQLHQIGLWPVTSLLPYPISKIVERIGEGHPEEARAILVQYCNPDFIEYKLVNTWKPIKVFYDRFEVFQEALFTHRSNKFRATIYTLIPQIEGVITDWLYEIVTPQLVNWKAESKIDQLHQEMGKIPQLESMWREALESAFEFLRHGLPMQTFKNWLDVIDPSFPGRHPVAHGKYLDDMFNVENSIKLFLLLDTICQFMMFYEVRVLGKSLEQGTAFN